MNHGLVVGRYAAVLEIAMTGAAATPAAIPAAPEAAKVAAPETPVDPPVSPASMPLIGEVSAPQDGRFKPMPARARAIAAAAVLAADLDLDRDDVAAGLGVAKRTLRNDLKDVTGEFPVVPTAGKRGGKAAAAKPVDTDFGFGAHATTPTA